jgi:hypothetical protein
LREGYLVSLLLDESERRSEALAKAFSEREAAEAEAAEVAAAEAAARAAEAAAAATAKAAAKAAAAALAAAAAAAAVGSSGALGRGTTGATGGLELEPPGGEAHAMAEDAEEAPEPPVFERNEQVHVGPATLPGLLPRLATGFGLGIFSAFGLQKQNSAPLTNPYSVSAFGSRPRGAIYRTKYIFAA